VSERRTPLEVERTAIDNLRQRRARLLALEQEERRVAPVRLYWSDPVGFARDCIDWPAGEFLADHQQAALENLITYRRECIRGPHGLGKTCTVAIAILWFALTRDGEDWKIITTASAWHQLEAYLWPEVHKWARRLRYGVIGREPLRDGAELLDRAIKLATGQASAASPDRKELIEGAHADHLLYVFDEAKTIPSDTFDAAEGAFATGDCYALAASTPGEPVGRFYEIQSRKAGTEDWHTTRVTRDEAIASGRMDPAWAAQRARQWGKASAVYINRVLGDFASSDEDSVIPLAWVEAANERWLAWHARGAKTPLTSVGVDVGRGGDPSVFALRCGSVVSELRESHVADVMDTTGRVLGILQAQGGYAVVDVIGIGAGVVDRLREQHRPVVAFNASERTDARDASGELGFINKRSAAWWAMREVLDLANDPQTALPPDDDLTGELTAPKWRPTSGGRIQVESKDDVRKRLGRSTDKADAVIQAFYTPPATPRTVRVVYEEPGGGISPF